MSCAQFPQSCFTRSSRFLVGGGGHIETSRMKVNGIFKVRFVSKATSGVFDPLNLGVDRFAGGIGNSMLNEGDDVFKPGLHHLGHFRHRLQPAADRPAVPPMKVFSCRSRIHFHWWQSWAIRSRLKPM